MLMLPSKHDVNRRGTAADRAVGEVSFIMPPMFAPAIKAPTTTVTELSEALGDQNKTNETLESHKDR